MITSHLAAAYKPETSLNLPPDVIITENKKKKKKKTKSKSKEEPAQPSAD